MGDYSQGGDSHEKVPLHNIISASFQTNALSYLKSGDLTIFTDVVNVGKSEKDGEFPLPQNHWINQTIPEENDKTLLHVALESNLHDFTQVLLQAGASAAVYKPNLSPIHVAAKAGSLRGLELLLGSVRGNVADVKATIKNGQTALHLVAEKGEEDCVNFLLQQREVDVNVKDKQNRTSLYLAAAKAKSVAIVKLLIEAGADLDEVAFGKSMRQVISENLPGLDPDSIRVKTLPARERNSPFDDIMDILHKADADGRDDDLDNFRSLLAQLTSDTINNTNFGGYTLLQFACHKNLDKFAALILDKAGADPNVTTKEVNITPILFAATEGNCTLLKLLIHHKADLTLVPQTSVTKENVLHAILRRGDSSRNHEECLRYLLRQTKGISSIINKRDALLNTPLHYATQMWSQEVVRKLLEVGANIGMKNLWDDVPISKIQPQTMEDFLDEFCIEAKGDVNNENFEVTFNYSFLAPPIEDVPTESQGGGNGVDPEIQGLQSDKNQPKVTLPETQLLWHMGQSKEHCHLLKHPVITSFLYLKWGRLRRDFNRNTRLYLSFVFILTWYIFEEFGSIKVRDQGEGRIQLWNTSFFIFFIVFTLFILREWVYDVKEKLRESQGGNGQTSGKLCCSILLGNVSDVVFLTFMGIVLISNRVKTLWVSLLILIVVLVAREVLRIMVSLKRYVLSPENWIEVSVIFLVSTILLFDRGSFDLKRHLAAVAIVLSWAQLITLVGKHPKLNRYNIYVVMFYKVMKTFLFFLCWYAFFIVAFGLGFYIMLHDPSAPPVAEAAEDDYVFFNSPWLALVKTSTMFVGELEFSDIPIKLDTSLTPVAYIFFLSFVFLIVVVLMNLLNGLAVSDIGVIWEQAETVSYISRVDTISYTEAFLLGDPLDFLSNWPALRWLRSLPSCSLSGQLYKNKAIRRLGNRMVNSTRLLLFYNYLRDKKLVLTPNSRKTNCSFLQVRIFLSSVSTRTARTPRLMYQQSHVSTSSPG